MRVLSKVSALTAAAALLLGACSSSSNSPARGPARDTAVVAEPANAPSYYIFPLTPLDNYNGLNDAYFQDQLYRPVYWIGAGGKATLNDRVSLADRPTFSDGGRTVAVRLKPYTWSDGKAVTSRDVLFFWNLLKVAKDNWSGYVPGEFPDNVRSVTTPDASTITFTFDKPYNPDWVLYNELSQLTPIPQHTWDVSGPGQAVSELDMTPAGAKKVYDYLIAQGKDASTYATNPLWQVVSGPFKVASFANGNEVTLAANPAYSGPVRPTLKTVVLKPFTSDTAEFNVLASGSGIDYGYVPPQAGTQLGRVERKGYTTSQTTSWSINYMVPNFNNPKVGPVLRQLYVRQAMAQLIDQDAWIKGPLRGFGRPTYGPVPTFPDNPFVDEQNKRSAYPFDPQKARTLLAEHGWTVKPDALTVCTSPGAGDGHCGPGIAAGTPLRFTVEYAAGLGALDNAMQAQKSQFSKVGIQLDLVSEPLDTVNAHETTCTPGQKQCTWQLVQGDLAWTFQPNYYPEGSLMFGSKGCCNPGSYADPRADALIDATHTSSSPSAMADYQDYVQKQLPVLWTPKAQSIVAVRSGLTGTQPQDPFGNLFPEEWRWK